MAPFVAALIRRPAACSQLCARRSIHEGVSSSGWPPQPLIRFEDLMAKKTRKQKQRAATRRPGTPAPATPGAGARQAAPSAPAAQRFAPVTSRPQLLPESVLPLPGTELEIESEPVEEFETPDALVSVADSSARRRVQRVNPAAQPRAPRGQVSAAAMFLPLDSDDAAIPFDRVPYVPRDLRRVAIRAASARPQWRQPPPSSARAWATRLW
jgi:hypothetical protein